MKYRIIAALLAALLVLSLTGCGSIPAPAQGDAPGQQTDTSADADAPAEDAAGDADTDEDAWKAEFEKSLLDNYNVTPDHYEELEGGVYQVYVEMDGKVIPFVVVDPATGDYHG